MQQRVVSKQKSLNATSVVPIAIAEKLRSSSTGIAIMQTLSEVQSPVVSLDTDITVTEFLQRVLVAALESETYEIQSVFLYGGNIVDFEMRITSVRPSTDLEQLQQERN